MITFTTLGQQGRLGNQLFQYAILLAVGAEKGYEVKIPSTNYRIWHGQKCLLNNFNITANEFTTDQIRHQYIENEVDYFKYNPSIFNIQDNTDISGFFQNYQYYKKHEELIMKELTPKFEVIQKNKETLSKIKEKYPDYLIVSLHIRRGDTKLNMYGEGNTLDPNSRWFQYFSRAKSMFEGKKCKFLVFTGGNRIDDSPTSDYVWCKNNLKSDEYVYWKYENTTINDFTLMYLSDAHILSPISSLSWWVGFLNKNNNKTIIAPEKYYFLETKMADGFYPNNFILF
jgi:hypothetical protein